MQQKDRRYDLVDMILDTLMEHERRLDDAVVRIELLIDEMLERHDNP